MPLPVAFTSFLIWFDCYTPFPPSFYSVVLVLALSSYLGCLAPFIYVYGCLFFSFLFLLFFVSPSESLPGKDVLCRLLPRPLPSVCFPFFSFLFRPCSPPICFWCNFLYLVTTAGFVTDQLIMWDKNNVCDFLCFVFNSSSSCDIGEPGRGSAPLSFLGS